MDPSVMVAIASVVVAIAAIVIASIFNVLTVRRSSKTLELAEQTYARTEERYPADLESARNERLRNALLDVMVATAAFNLQSAWYAKLLNDYANGHITVDAAQAQDIEQLRPASAEAFRTVQIALFICDNEEIKRIVDDIGKQITRAVGVVVSSHRRTPAGFRQGSR